jgi:hypothetical protein
MLWSLPSHFEKRIRLGLWLRPELRARGLPMIREELIESIARGHLTWEDVQEACDTYESALRTWAAAQRFTAGLLRQFRWQRAKAAQLTKA